MRRLPAAAASLGLVALALVGCSASQTPTCDRTASVGDIGDLVTVDGDPGQRPDADVPSPLRISSLQYHDVVTGDGTTIVSSNQGLDLGLTLINGTTGETIVDLGYDGQTQLSAIDAYAQTIPAFDEVLHCATAGSRIVAGLAEDDIAPTVLETFGVDASTPVVAIIDVRDVLLSAADGAEQFNESHGLPTVVRAPDGRPGIIVPEAEAPEGAVIQTLKRGDGATVEDGDTVYVHFSSVSWDDPAATLKTSWDAAPQSVTLAPGDDPVLNALRGATIGSQILLVAPAAADATGGPTVYVFDVLGTLG